MHQGLDLVYKVVNPRYESMQNSIACKILLVEHSVPIDPFISNRDLLIQQD